jgi:NADH:ubiquinone oxidoreductase subunit F (NADH-binding)
MTARERLDELVEAAAREPGAALRLIVGLGGCGRARGADAVMEALRDEIAGRGLDAEVVAGGCNGMCHAQVLVDVQWRDRPRMTFAGQTPAGAACLLDEAVEIGERDSFGDGSDWFIVSRGPTSQSLEGGLVPAADVPFLAPQQRLLMRDLGAIDPAGAEEYVRRGGYASLARALDELAPEDLVAEVKSASLLGRGGAYFPTALKWEGCRAAPGAPKWLVVNAEEGEPGVFKDRHLLEGDPHRVIEGMLLAAYAIGATRGIFYVNGEAKLAQQRVVDALDQARSRGLLGERILGSSFSFEVEPRHGAGGYILGEETALLESIEGRRAMPRVRPPFPVERGLWGKPTVVNSTETLAALRTIVEMGGDTYARIGQGATGTKLIGLSGNVARPGLVEVPFGTTMRRLVEGCGGGVPDGRRLAAVLIGGPSGIFVPAACLDEPMQPRGAVPPGTGGWVVLDERQSVLDAVRRLTRYNMVESCGKCTPCREGTVRLVELLDRFADGTSEPADLASLGELNEVVETASLCGLGQMAPRPIVSALQHFAYEFEGKVS